MRVPATDVRDEEAGRDRVDSDPVARELERDRVHEVAGSSLGGHVGGADRRLDPGRGERRGDDDPPEAARAHVAGGGASGREHAAEVDVDHAVPALVAVALELALGHPRPLVSRPGPDETGARVDPGVGERDVEPAVQAGRLVDHGVQHGVVGHVGNRGSHVEAFAGEPRGLSRDRAAIDVDQRDAGAVGCEHLSVGKPDAAGAAGHDDPEPVDVELRRNVHSRASLAPDPGAAVRRSAIIARCQGTPRGRTRGRPSCFPRCGATAARGWEPTPARR